VSLWWTRLFSSLEQNIFSTCVDPAHQSFACSTDDSFFFCVAKTTFNTFAECFVFSLSSDVSQHQKLNQQRCLVSQRVDALGRWNNIIKIIRLTKNVAVTNGFFSSFFWEFTFQAGKNLKLDANETVRKDYRKAIKVTLKFVSTSAFFFFLTFSRLKYSFNEMGKDCMGSNAFLQNTQKLPNASAKCV